MIEKRTSLESIKTHSRLIMSRYFPHSTHAEDQPWSRTILTTHAVTRGLTTGTMIGAGIFGARQIFQRFRSTEPRMGLYLRTTGRATQWTVACTLLALVGHMWEREEIEWKDRSWRLTASKGQLETDDWTYGGMAAGFSAAAAVLPRPLVWSVAGLGAVGTGSVLGMLGYCGWRYGIYGGRFGDEK
ncbi:hypothetical protein GGR50DRAFT_301399 [Xylaria sp. CBS 124048]|nr:hypothetical protein GGR50DRAFT_301399 [Xylaria sp. CBS 124048]